MRGKVSSAREGCQRRDFAKENVHLFEGTLSLKELLKNLARRSDVRGDKGRQLADLLELHSERRRDAGVA